MKKHLVITIVIEAIIIALLFGGILNLRNQLKETQSDLTEAQASYERCVEKNETLQSLYQVMVDEVSHLRKEIRKYDPNYGIVYF